MLLGVAALAVSAGGALTVTGGLGGESAPRFSQASALSGVSDVSRFNTLGRDVVSRDSRRDALADTAQSELQDQVEEQSRQRDAAIAELAQKTQAYSDKLRLNAWQLPVSGYHLTARFGDYSGLWSHFHTGLDFAAPSGTQIHAVANGVVTSVGYDGAYGNKTVITLDDGTELWYCHQTSYTVNVGDVVHGGDLIGYVGSTGNVTGPHLHLEVRPGGGDPVDPYAALVVHGVTP
jgi:murein DD-endopeptidase MepM/ murein hydrolase activator NlpD